MKIPNNKSNLRKIIFAGIVGGSLLGSCTSPQSRLVQLLKDVSTERARGLEKRLISSLYQSNETNKQRKTSEASTYSSHRFKTKDFPLYFPPLPNPELQSVLREEEKNFFPLSEGNSWTYIRTGSSNMIVSYPANTYKKEDKRLIAKESIEHYPPHHTPKPINMKSEETYTIIGKTEDGLWNVKVEGTNPRDGRYTHAEDIKWGFYDIGLLELREVRSNNQDVIEQSWLSILRPDTTVSSFTGTKTYLPPYSTYGLAGEGKLIELQHKKHTLTLNLGAIEHTEPITVPVRKFTGGLKCIIEVFTVFDLTLLTEPLFGREVDGQYIMDWLMGSTTELYFAKGVGLIKEIKYNVSREEIYRLELKSYNVK